MKFDDLASRLTTQYETFLFSLTGKYLGDRVTGSSPQSIKRIQLDAYRFARGLLYTATGEIDNYLSPLLKDAPDGLKTSLKARRDAMLGRLSAAVVENIKDVAARLKSDALGVNPVKGLTGSMAELAKRRSQGGAEFKITDSSGRKWDAVRLMQVMIRDFGYQSWLDQQFSELAGNGYDHVESVQDGHDPVQFSISGEIPGIASLADIRQTVFHPNGIAMVRHV